MIIRLFHIALFVALAFPLKAQFISYGGWLGYTAHMGKSSSTQTFFQSYNELNSDKISEGFRLQYGNMHGWGFNGFFAVNDGGFELRGNMGYCFLDAPANEAIFTNGEIRRMSVRSKDLNIDLGIGGGTEYFFANVNVGMLVRAGFLYSSYQYQDGTESFGSELGLNGVYHSRRLTSLLGITIGGGSENLKVVFRGDYVLPATGELTYQSSYDDVKDYKRSRNWYIPADMEKYSSFEIDVFNKVYNDFGGIRLSLALQIALHGDR